MEIDDCWVELSYGWYEGVLYVDVLSEVWERWWSDYLFILVGGESLVVFDECVRAVVVDVASCVVMVNVVVVSYVLLIKAVVVWVFDVGIGLMWNSYLD